MLSYVHADVHIVFLGYPRYWGRDLYEDFCELLIDPILHATAKAAKNKPARGAWGGLQQWAAWDSVGAPQKKHAYMDPICIRDNI